MDRRAVLILLLGSGLLLAGEPPSPSATATAAAEAPAPVDPRRLELVALNEYFAAYGERVAAYREKLARQRRGEPAAGPTPPPESQAQVLREIQRVFAGAPAIADFAWDPAFSYEEMLRFNERLNAYLGPEFHVYLSEAQQDGLPLIYAVGGQVDSDRVEKRSYWDDEFECRTIIIGELLACYPREMFSDRASWTGDRRVCYHLREMYEDYAAGVWNLFVQLADQGLDVADRTLLPAPAELDQPGADPERQVRILTGHFRYAAWRPLYLEAIGEGRAEAAARDYFVERFVADELEQIGIHEAMQLRDLLVHGLNFRRRRDFILLKRRAAFTELHYADRPLNVLAVKIGWLADEHGRGYLDAAVDIFTRLKGAVVRGRERDPDAYPGVEFPAAGEPHFLAEILALTGLSDDELHQLAAELFAATADQL